MPWGRLHAFWMRNVTRAFELMQLNPWPLLVVVFGKGRLWNLRRGSFTGGSKSLGRIGEFIVLSYFQFACSVVVGGNSQLPTLLTCLPLAVLLLPLWIPVLWTCKLEQTFSSLNWFVTLLCHSDRKETNTVWREANKHACVCKCVCVCALCKCLKAEWLSLQQDNQVSEVL